MNISKRLAKGFRSFTSADKGNVGMLFAISIVPMFLAVGAAVDFSRYSAAQAQVQAALDAGALAAAAAPSGTDTAKRIKIGEDTFKANLSGGVAGGLDVKASFTTDKGKIIGVTTGNMPTSLMKLGGVNSLALNENTEVNMVTNKKAEIVMVLDYSGSMGDSVKGGQKYKLMSAAASKLVSDLKTLEKGTVKVGLVPFSQYVRATLPANHVVGATGSSWTGCTQDRMAPHNLTGDEPNGSNDSKWGQPLNTEHAGYTCGGFTASNLKIVPLTEDYDKVTSQLGGMKPYGYTHIALGLEFGYHVISKSSPYNEGVEFGDKDTDKYIVLLTDGSQTESAKGPGGIKSVDQGEKNLEALCANLKGNQVTVITMAFDLTDKDPSKAEATKDRLRACATNPASDYFDANSGSDLSKAFDSIRAQVAQNIFLNK